MTDPVVKSIMVDLDEYLNEAEDKANLEGEEAQLSSKEVGETQWTSMD